MTDYNYEVVDWVKGHASIQPDGLAMVDLASNRRYSYDDMHERVARVAGLLKARGVKKGDRVGFLALNSTDVLEIIFATWRLGAVSLALNFRLTPNELEYIVNDATPDVIFLDEVFAPVGEALKGMTKVKHWISFDGVGGDTEYEQEIASASPVYDMQEELFVQDQCLLMYSSGTTGKPKGVIITHGMMMWSGINAKSFSDVSHKSVNLCFMPLFHIGGLNVFASPVVYSGGTNIIMRMVDTGAILDCIDNPEIGVTHFLAVPAIYNGLKEHPKAETTDYSRVQAALAGGEAVPANLVKWWVEKGLYVQEGFGMTETAASTTLLGKEDIPRKIGSAGKIGMHGAMLIADQDGKEVPVGEVGELCLKGVCITPGYWNRDDANEDGFRNGWFRTGDLARIDEEGFLYIEDRVKDMYISGGENVYPAEVENALGTMAQISEVAVIGVQDDRWGETGCACVVLKRDCSLSLEEVQTHVMTTLARYKHPNHLHVVDALPRNATGKVLKYQLRDDFAAQNS